MKEELESKKRKRNLQLNWYRKKKDERKIRVKKEKEKLTAKLVRKREK